MVVIPFQKGSNAERSRSRNKQAVLVQVRGAGTIGRAEIARALSLTTQTVSNIIAELFDDGMLLDKGRLSAGRGLPAIQYALNPEGGYALGIEVRPDAVFAALLDMQGRSVSSERIALQQNHPEVVLTHVKALYRRALDKVPTAKGRMLGAGIVMPGPLGVTGIAGMESDLTGWQEVDAAALFTDATGLPVMLSNDANAAAIAERLNGVAQDIASFAYLYFGAGLGLGLIHQGQLVSGAYGNAGEIGHIPIPDSIYGQSGKLEDALSRLSVERHLRAANKAADRIDALEQLFEQRDPDLFAWLDTASDALGHAMVIVENLFDPQTVVLGGAMPDAILDHLVAHAPLPSLSVSNRPQAPFPRLMRGASGRMTATFGAAALILNRALSAPISHTH
ncbi:ROK family protein [Octadecabacter antarcticus 307]|uniref:ROK family protein n=1 Tax=Octadecabacter antarcticus 307 TaxID=391626 RepID=M9RD02_9RHOB|nr:ROK family transcriptional regulator [Octadecabacter antarcticus]AGI69638.1 ROK family protein [Octadecabacter antarcticus 307]